MPIVYRYATLQPAEGSAGPAYLSEPIFLEDTDDLLDVEQDIRQAAGDPGGYGFVASQAFGTDAACKQAIADRDQELRAHGYAVERISLYDNEVL